jgi:ribosome-associated protein YbcJ (S4-like RNA binding protein)
MSVITSTRKKDKIHNGELITVDGKKIIIGDYVTVNKVLRKDVGKRVVETLTEPRLGMVVGYRWVSMEWERNYDGGGFFTHSSEIKKACIVLVLFHPTLKPVYVHSTDMVPAIIPLRNPHKLLKRTAGTDTGTELKRHMKENPELYPRDNKGKFIPLAAKS